MKIVLLANDSTYVYNLRKEVIDALLEKKYQVSIVCKPINYIETLQKMGCEVIPIEIQRHGKNPLQDLALYQFYRKTLKKLQPDVVLTYNIKPNIYGGTACSRLGISYLPNICGLGTALEYDGAMQKLTTFMYRIGMKKAKCVFFQNTENEAFFAERKMNSCKHIIIPGSGVNLQKYTVLPYPTDNVIEFLFISRVMKEKGADQYLEAAEIIKSKYPNTMFHVLGNCDDARYLARLEKLQNSKIIQYHGQQKDILQFQMHSSCTVHPTYYPEGMSNVLLESAACGRPIITTDRSGCREIVEDGINGFICKQKDTADLVLQIEKFLALSPDARRAMGLAGRAKVEKEFDRQLVVKAYMEEIQNLIGG